MADVDRDDRDLTGGVVWIYVLLPADVRVARAGCQAGAETEVVGV